MVYIELNGRLGNHLFQIATAASLAKRNNSEFTVVCHDRYQLPDKCTLNEYIQQFKASIFKDISIITKIPDNCKNFTQEGHLFKSIPYYDNIFLVGTFQSEKYFDPTVVRKQFQIPNDLKDSLYQRYGHILKKSVTSIHVRRGDYLKDPHLYNITSMDFFRKAMRYIGKETRFLIISDDINWCKKNFKGANYFFTDNNTPLEDLYLQSLCTNNIISNSTFSWWGAWLNENPDKIVIAPKPWFGKDFAHFRTHDLIPEGWIELNNSMSLPMKLKAIKIMRSRAIKNFLRPIYYSFKRNRLRSE